MSNVNVRNELRACAYRKPLQYLKTVDDVAVPERITFLDNDSMIREGNRVTVTFFDAHGMATGDQVRVAGAAQAGYNGIWPVIVIDATTVSFDLPKTLVLPAQPTGPIEVYRDIFFRKATLLGMKTARTDNAGLVWAGWSAADGSQPFRINAGGEASFEAPIGEKWSLGDIYIDVENAGDGVVVSYT